MREGQQERAQARTAGGSSERQLWESEAGWDPGPAFGAQQARAGQKEDYRAAVTFLTDWACGPLGPWVTSNST